MVSDWFNETDKDTSGRKILCEYIEKNIAKKIPRVPSFSPGILIFYENIV